MATEGEEVAVNVPAKTNESRALEEHSTLPNGSPSIVADVLSKKGLNAATSVNQAMKELSQKTDGLKGQIYGFIYKQYTEFYHEFNLGDELNKKLAKLIREINKLGDDIENDTLVTMATAGSELQQLTNEYEKNQEIIKSLKKLLKMHDCIRTCANGLHYKDYLVAAKANRDMRNHLNDLSAGTCDIKIFKAIREEYRLKKAFMMSDLESTWSQLLDWDTVTTASWDNIDGHLKTTLRVYKPHSDSHGVKSLNSLYEAMDCIGILDPRLKAFAKKMSNFLLKPLIKFPNLKPVVENDRIKLAKEEVKVKGKKQEPVDVYRKLFGVLQFIATKVFPREEEIENEATGNDKNQNEATHMDILKKLQPCVWPELSELIIKDCLAAAIPYKNSQLKEYDQIIKLTRNFELELFSIGFLEEDSKVLSSYAENINVHFANKKVQDLLVKARDLMTSKIHSMVKVEVDEDRARLVTEVNENEKKFSKQTVLLLAGLKDIPESALGTKIFQFPECRISESTKSLINLAYDTMLAASTSTTRQVAVQLFYSVRNMFELFCNVVPVYHKETLELPQMAALHYNNSMYLAHHCVTMSHQFKPTLPDLLGEGAATFVDYVPVLRNCGQKVFLENLKKQKDTLLEIIRECNGFNDLETEEGVFTTQKAFEQIINHLVRLSRVWKDVLPQHIYEKTLPLLLHTVLDTITTQIIQIEDISTEQGRQFHRLLKILSERSPEIFNLKSKDEDSSEDMGFIVRVQSWQKFNEVIQMMDSSLQGIVDRWADGKGPLAQCFEASDVRSLIKALFQNTNIRAQALSKIKQS